MEAVTVVAVERERERERESRPLLNKGFISVANLTNVYDNIKNQIKVNNKKRCKLCAFLA